VALDLGILARTALARRLLGGKPGPFAPLEAGRLEELEARLRTGQTELRDAVRTVLASVVPGGSLTPAMTAVADRWAGSLAPLDPVLTSAGLSAPRG
jgi:hypothetical protein